MADFGRFLIGVGACVWLFFIFLAYSVGHSANGGTGFFAAMWDVRFGMAAGSIPVLIGGVITHLEVRKHQERRNDYANRVLKAVTTGDEDIESLRYTLYLRPFEHDKEFVLESIHQQKWFPGSTANHVTTDQAMVQRLRQPDKIVGVRLKQPNWPVGGIGTIVLEDSSDWQAPLEKLIVHASRLFVVPHDSHSVIWEISKIKELGRLRETQFFNVKKSLNTTAEFERVFGFRPKLDPKDFPVLYRVNESGEVFDSSAVLTPKKKDWG